MKVEQFTSIVTRIRPRLMALASQFDANTAEDAVQEALMRLWTSWQQLAEPADAERLAVRLTKHACIDNYRRSRRQQTVGLKEVALAETADATDESALQAALERAVNGLPPAERRLWTMYAEAQMNSAQIAAATGINNRSVSSMLSSARHHICETLKKGGLL
jgi:RNA polymerase sigma-70 factor (ECF subfamily)